MWRKVSEELRNQLNSLNDSLSALQGSVADLESAVQARPMLPASVNGVSLSVSNPPTQAQVQAIVDKLNELIGALET